MLHCKTWQHLHTRNELSASYATLAEGTYEMCEKAVLLAGVGMGLGAGASVVWCQRSLLHMIRASECLC